MFVHLASNICKLKNKSNLNCVIHPSCRSGGHHWKRSCIAILFAMTIRVQPGSCLADRGPKKELIKGPVIKSKIEIYTLTASVYNRQSRASTAMITCQTQPTTNLTRPNPSSPKFSGLILTLASQLHSPICFPHTAIHTFIYCSFFTQHFQVPFSTFFTFKFVNSLIFTRRFYQSLLYMYVCCLFSIT